MKKYLSVLALDVRSTIYKIFLILIIMALTRVVDYKLVFHNLMEKRQEWSAPLSNVLVSTTSVSNMPTERLPVTWAEVLDCCGYHIVVYLALIAAQILLVLWPHRDYQAQMGIERTPQALAVL